MKKLTQNDSPIYEALKRHLSDRVVKFDVPGHKGGRGNPELTGFLGEAVMKADVNSMKPLDNLCHPTSVIQDAERLASEAFGAAHTFFMVGGTTSSVQAMILYACKAGDKIIMPRNVHRSSINALVLCGAVPVYVNPGTDRELGIPLGMSVSEVEKALDENPGVKAILINNPTYYGICSDIRSITELAHRRNVLVLADEAHGTHFYFGDGLPLNAMSAGCDLAAVSTHKTGGSLTQSSFLLCGKNIHQGYMRQIINLTQTTSASYLLMISLDLARKNLALHGKELFKGTLEMASYARLEINRAGGYRAFGRELIDGGTVFDFDETKLSVNTLSIGLAGIEVYDLLRDEYGIQIEFGDLGNILAIISAGDRILEIERLISALIEIKRLYSKDKAGMFDHEYIPPKVFLPPQQAFYSKKRAVEIGKSAGMVCGEFVMCYPPGIPILAPGEIITEEIIGYIAYAKEKGCLMTGTEDLELKTIMVTVE